MKPCPTFFLAIPNGYDQKTFQMHSYNRIFLKISGPKLGGDGCKGRALARGVCVCVKPFFFGRNHVLLY